MLGLYGRNIDNPVIYCRLHDCYLGKGDARRRCGYKGYNKKYCNNVVVLNDVERTCGLDYECWMFHQRWRERRALKKRVKQLLEQGNVEEARKCAGELR